MMRKRMHIFLLICLLSAPMPALAHKVTVFAWVEGEMVHTQSKFSGGKKVNAGKIEVFDQRERKLLEGATDVQGQFSFPRPEAAASLKVVLTSGMGHTNYWIIRPEELGGGAAARTPSAVEAPAAPSVSPDGGQRDDGAIEAIVQRVVQRELAPIKAQLAREPWGLRDIVAGIGYIIGLMGLASYMQHRKTGRAGDGS